MQLASFQKTFKIAGLVIVLAVVLAVTIFFGQKASTVFLAKASTCPAANISVKQVTANSAVIYWETADVTQGMVNYGTSATDLPFSAPEASSGKVHNVPITLLTPNTVYYYLITIGNKKCDSSGQTCDKDCVPLSFTTAAITSATNTPAPTVAPTLTLALTPTLAISPTRSATPSPTRSVTPTASRILSPSPTSMLSAFCQKVKDNIGASSIDTIHWPSIEQYDIDNNGVINGLDIIKCQQQGL